MISNKAGGIPQFIQG